MPGHLFHEEYGFCRAHFLERGSQVLAGLHVGDAENEARIRHFLCSYGISLLLLAIPKPLVELLLGEASALNQLAEVLFVPRPVVEMVVAYQQLHLLLCFATLVLQVH